MLRSHLIVVTDDDGKDDDYDEKDNEKYAIGAVIGFCFCF